MKKSRPAPVQAGMKTKTIFRSAAIAIVGAFGLVSCASDPYSTGNQGYYGNPGYPSANNVAPLIATGVAVAALAGYANERQSRKNMKNAIAYQNAVYHGHYRHPGYRPHRPPPPPYYRR